MQNGITVEICCGSLADARAADECGADRIELNTALELGGLTASLSALRLFRQKSALPAVCMVRPRTGGFLYSEEDFAVMLGDAALLLDGGASGVAFGFLLPDCAVDRERTARMASLIREKGGEPVFHRAFDVVPQKEEALALLAQLGVARVLTSGGPPTAPEGAAQIASLVRAAEGRIAVLAGGGVRRANAEQLIRATGVRQIHFSCHAERPDPTGGQYGAPVREIDRRELGASLAALRSIACDA